MSFVWMVMFVVLVIIELLTVNLVSIWFAIGSFISFIASLWLDNVTIQIVIFICVSFISLLLTKNVVKKFKTNEITPTNLDRVIGKIGIVTEEVTELEPGEVKVDGKKWSAISNKKIEVGKNVEIISIDGVKLNVKEII